MCMYKHVLVQLKNEVDYMQCSDHDIREYFCYFQETKDWKMCGP